VIKRWRKKRRDQKVTVVHVLKCANPYFAHVMNGRKSFEVRVADRDFQVGDLIVLRELAGPRACLRRIRYILALDEVRHLFPSMKGESNLLILGLDSPLEYPIQEES
jgi:hypothetical protein